MSFVLDRSALLDDLKRGVVEVHFTKVNGDQRVMRCTLMPQLLPPNHDIKEEQDFHSKNLDVVAVWDTQKGGWRSFRLDSVGYAQLLDSY